MATTLEDKRWALYAQGATDEMIAKMTGTDVQQVVIWRKRHSIAKNTGRRPAQPREYKPPINYDPSPEEIARVNAGFRQAKEYGKARAVAVERRQKEKKAWGGK